MITIGRCQTADVPDVLAFLDAHWKPGHIFGVERRLFDWQYARPDRPGEYSIVLARRDDDRTLVGMLGYITTRRFDPALADDNAIWLALWKVRTDVATGGVGLRLLSEVTENEPHTSVGVISSLKKTKATSSRRSNQEISITRWKYNQWHCSLSKPGYKWFCKSFIC